MGILPFPLQRDRRKDLFSIGISTRLYSVRKESKHSCSNYHKDYEKKCETVKKTQIWDSRMQNPSTEITWRDCPSVEGESDGRGWTDGGPPPGSVAAFSRGRGARSSSPFSLFYLSFLACRVLNQTIALTSLSLSLSLSRSRDTLSLPDLDHLLGFSGIKRSNLHWVQNVG